MWKRTIANWNYTRHFENELKHTESTDFSSALMVISLRFLSLPLWLIAHYAHLFSAAPCS